ncbi:MAG TPA: hypothetical protein VFT74_18825 [Isosphaeraceae bacterium]|nr:hypothetical protein [Isosphaeraceae bacterium]
MLNTAILKTVGFWVAVITAILGVLLSQHVVLDGSTAAAVIGWLMTFGGAGATGHQIASAPKADPAA